MVVSAVVATVVTGGAISTQVYFAGGSGGSAPIRIGSANVMMAMQPALPGAPGAAPAVGGGSATAPPPAPGASTPATPSATPSTHRATPKPTTKPPSRPTPPPAAGSVVDQLLAQINDLRAQHGLPPLTPLSGLIASAHAHNVKMMGSCGLSHQCPGEASLGSRISAQGVHWTTCGENIGWSGPHADTTSAIVAAAEGITLSMYNEKPPDDGHRRNLLSSSFHHIGIDVQRDSRGRVWLTQDFSN
jgi:uncharacterized protein YkwD